MTTNFNHMVGQRFGRLLVIWESDDSVVGKRTFPRTIRVKCDCGVEKTVTARHVRRGRAQSCGCLHREIITKHGNSGKRAYAAWKTMKARCYNKKNRMYKYYGAKGIRVSDEWIDNFEAFETWLNQNGWSKGLQVDRKNTQGDYTPSNCRLVTPTQNANNTSSNRILVVMGERLTVAEASRSFGIPYDVLCQRVNKLGWDDERAVTTPVRACRRRAK